MFNMFYLYLFTKFPAHSYNGYILADMSWLIYRLLANLHIGATLIYAIKVVRKLSEKFKQQNKI